MDGMDGCMAFYTGMIVGLYCPGGACIHIIEKVHSGFQKKK
jgi:hypothetical protein